MKISGLVLISFLLCSVFSVFPTLALADTPLKSKVNVTQSTPIKPKIVKQVPITPKIVKQIPVKQTPIKPNITKSTPITPEISKSLPVKPKPIKPTPVAPTKIKPTPVQPTPVKPTPIKPTPVAPTKIAPTPVKPTPVTPTPIKPSSLSGKWAGSAQGTAVFADINGQDLNCKFTGHATLDLTQTGNSLTGHVAVTNISLVGDGCEQVGFAYEGDLNSTIFGSGFSGTVDTLNVSGQFTSDLIKAKYNGNVDANAVNGELTVSRMG